MQQLQARAMALQGRGGDSEVAHVTVGEIVLPKALQTRAVIEALGHAAGAAGIPLAHLRVGSGRNAINPHTGSPEFFGPKDEEQMEEIVVTAPREVSVNKSPLSVDEYGRSPEDISNPDFRRGQGQALINALPGVGLADASGYLLNWKEGDGFLPSGIQKHPSLVENLSNGNYGAAALSGLGALGDLAPALAPALRAPPQAVKLTPLLKDALNRSNVYDKGAMAAEEALSIKRDVLSAMEHPGGGAPIDFRWNEGTTGGLFKIQKKHGDEAVRDVPFVVAYGTQVPDPKGTDRTVMMYGPKKVVIDNDFRGSPSLISQPNLMAVTVDAQGDHYGLTTLVPDATASYLKSNGKIPLWSQGAYPGNRPR